MIDHFQLENLLNNYVHFYFYSLLPLETLPSELTKKLTSSSGKLRHFNGLNEFEREHSDTQMPVVLLCGTGRKSALMARKLTQCGFVNVYVLEGGLNQLMGHIIKDT